jgi:hypothetical protein
MNDQRIMVSLIMHCIFLLFILFHGSKGDFAPDTKSYDAYGLKLTGNDFMMIEARSDSKTFLVQYAPYNYTTTSLQCSIAYDDPSHYVYSVAIGAQQKANKDPYFFVVGEVLPPSDLSGNNGTFVALWRNNDSILGQEYANTGESISCN